MQIALIALSTSLLLSGPQQVPTSGGSSTSDEGRYPIHNCLTTLIREIDIAAQEAGVLKEVPLLVPLVPAADGTPQQQQVLNGDPQFVEIREGMDVKKGQLLGQIDDDLEKKLQEVAEHKLDVAKEEAGNKVSVDYAQAGYDVATKELEQAKDANRRSPNTVVFPLGEIRRMALSQEQARLGTEQASFELGIAKVSVSVRKAELDVTDLQIARRKIVSPIDGIVVQRYVDVGEWVTPGAPVLKVISMDYMRIKGSVEASKVSRSQVDKAEVTVSADFLGFGERTFKGKVVFVDPRDVAGRQGSRFEVWAEVENKPVGAVRTDRVRLPPGMSVTMHIKLNY